MIVVDVETGGLNHWQHPMLSIGAVDFNNRKDTFYGEIQADPKRCTAQALKINDRDPTKGDNVKDVMDRFHAWLQPKNDKILAGHNPRFDLDFVNHTFRSMDIKFQFSFRTVDLHSIAWARWGESLSANGIYEKLQMGREPDPHNALTGAIMEAVAFGHLLSSN